MVRAGNAPLTRAERVRTRVRFVVVIKSPSRPWGRFERPVSCGSSELETLFESNRRPPLPAGAPKRISNDDDVPVTGLTVP